MQNYIKSKLEEALSNFDEEQVKVLAERARARETLNSFTWDDYSGEVKNYVYTHRDFLDLLVNGASKEKIVAFLETSAKAVVNDLIGEIKCFDWYLDE